MDLTTEDLTKPQQQPRLLTVTEAAQELRISNWSIYGLIRTKQLPTLTIGTRRLVATDDLSQFILKRKEIGNET
jgi:excisionase family DNA binding protein